MLKIKVFYESNQESDLEERINDWLEANPKTRVRSINFTGNGSALAALVLYEDLSKTPPSPFSLDAHIFNQNKDMQVLLSDALAHLIIYKPLHFSTCTEDDKTKYNKLIDSIRALIKTDIERDKN